MFGDYLIFDSVSKLNATKIYDKLDKSMFLKRKSIISIGGISGTRKSETAYKLAEIFITHGRQCHIISGDDYYTTAWNLRNNSRKNHLDIVGPEEMDWKRLEWTFETFINNMFPTIQSFLMSKFSTDLMRVETSKENCDILIFEGLYGCDARIESDIKVHIGSTDPDSTFKFRSKRKKENESSEFRKEVVKKECDAVNKLKENADIII